MKEEVDVLYYAFSKAFDVVFCIIHTGKLRKCGLDKWTVRWIQTWLNGRAQRMLISADEFSCGPLGSGITKGSILNSVLFNLFISDLEGVTESNLSKSDDDTKLREVVDALECCAAILLYLN